MRSLTKAAVCLAGLLVVADAGDGARAATTNVTLTPSSPTSISLGSPTSGTTYVYGDMSFDFTTCTNCTGLEIEAIFNGRGGTEIEILKSSAIFNNTAGSSNGNLNFNLQVNVNSGSRGVSSVTNILTGSANLSANNGNVTSVLSSFSPPSATGTPSSNLNTPTSVETFNIVSSGSSFSFKTTLSDKSFNATQADTLVLSNVKLLFNPAPEPTTIALFATGMAGLAAARSRRRSGRVRSGNSPILGS